SADIFACFAHLINVTSELYFNFMRGGVDAVRVLASSSAFRLYALRVADKFGDYGLTGVVVVEIAAGGRTWNFDTLLLSCRVLGRGVETALLAALAGGARAGGALGFPASFVPTRKDALAATYLPDHGFRQDGDGSWRLAMADAPSIPDFIALAPPAGRAQARAMAEAAPS